ncbi:MAG: general secretion pathway protein GspB [Gammaproteobacteria bacterium]
MSFILDALRKSEHERQRNSGPGLAEIPTAIGKGGHNRWMPLVVALLAINVLIMAGFLLWPDEAPTPGLVAIAAPEATSKESTPADRQRVAAPVTPPAGDAAHAPPTNREVRPLSREVAGSMTAAVGTASETPLAGVSGRAPATEIYPTLNDLLAAGMIALPGMHIDIHVFSNNPAERFVFLNMRKYREGETTREGPAIHSITPQGVVLNHRGTLFLLPTE